MTGISDSNRETDSLMPMTTVCGRVTDGLTIGAIANCERLWTVTLLPGFSMHAGYCRAIYWQNGSTALMIACFA